MDQKSHQSSRNIMFHPFDLPDISPCDFWFFGTLKGILKAREFKSSDEIEEAIAKFWVGFTFDKVQSVLHN
jgi:hypothetical protein